MTQKIDSNRSKTIGITEIQAYLIEIANAFDYVCSSHKIPYYMLGGSMLGAIRHRGFIPWDDDMDFGVPMEHYYELIDYLEKELPYPYRCSTYKNHPSVLFNYFKIEDIRTRINDSSINLPIEMQLGINIDVFPLTKCKESDHHIAFLRKTESFLGFVFLDSIHSRFRFVKRVLRFCFGNSPRLFQNSIERQLHRIKPGNCRGNLLGRWKEREIIPNDWYGEGSRYVFENTSFVGLEEYDSYLNRLYGNYMSLPPIQRQTPHVGDVYYLND